MPIVIEPTAVASAVQDSHHKLDRYAIMGLTPEQSLTVVYSKLESQGDLADLRHTTPPWVEQYTSISEGQLGYRNIFIHHGDGEPPESGAGDHEGFIFTFHGAPSGTVALDPNTKQILTQAQADIQEETFNQRLPRYTQWDFRLHEVIVTDGPARRARLMESNEEQRARAEEKYLNGQDKMIQKQMAFFEILLQKISANGGQTVVTADALKDIATETAVGSNLQPEQVAALDELQRANDEYEKENAGMVAVDTKFDVTPVKRGRPPLNR
mgnify:CR=1 FL=1